MPQDTNLKLQKIIVDQQFENLSIEKVRDYTYEIENVSLGKKWKVVFSGNRYTKFVNTIDGWKFVKKGITDRNGEAS